MDRNFIHYKIFEAFAELEAFTTTKNSLNGQAVRFTGDAAHIFADNRKELAELLGIEVVNLVFPRQTHTSTVHCIDVLPDYEISETDALVTNKPGICICVQTADCVPVLLFDPVKKVIAAVHAGWKGTVQKIVQVTVQKMEAEYDCEPSDIRAAIGPSIGPEVYEVGAEVVEAALRSIPAAESTLQLNQSGKYHFNLWEANRLLLIEAGVQTSNIEVLADCSFLEADKYYSARREGVQTGRMVSGILLKTKLSLK
jgi:purine-nucleoside/S-methyl-5'-thioadenosine phosphorylase / adenosine deaminase